MWRTHQLNERRRPRDNKHGSNIWSSSRYVASIAWISNGAHGCWSGNYFYFTYVAVPVALLDVSEANI